jgi:hypothetical protein
LSDSVCGIDTLLPRRPVAARGVLNSAGDVPDRGRCCFVLFRILELDTIMQT